MAPSAMVKKENDHPYIIALGTSKSEIIKYYIEIEKHVIPVSFKTMKSYNIVSNFLNF